MLETNQKRFFPAGKDAEDDHVADKIEIKAC